MASDNQKIVQEAAEWFVTLRDTEALSAGELQQQQQQFSVWLKQSPEHVHEYLMISRLWGDVGDLDIAGDVRLAGAQRRSDAGQARTDGAPAAVARDADPAAAAPETATRQRRRRWPLYALAAGLLLALPALFFWPQPARFYETGIGEQRTVTLTDGSLVKLNTRSQIRTWFADGQRRVQLIRGEALFNVAPDRQQPFIVDTGVAGGRAFVKVLGTTFNIYQKDRETAVTVLEGRVLVAPGAFDRSAHQTTAGGYQEDSGIPESGQAELHGGQQAILTTAKTHGGGKDEDSSFVELRIIRDVDTSRIIAWTEHRLVFDEQPLAAIIDEFNRYNRPKMEVATPSLAALPLSGVFSSDDPESLLLYLRQIRNIRVTTSADGVRVIREQ